MALYESGEDYLEAILVLRQEHGIVRSIDVAQHLAVSYTHLTLPTNSRV